MLVHKLNQLKEKTNLNYQQIAEKSGVASSTVQRIFSGQTAHPSYQDVANIVQALGGSLDAMEGIEHPHEKTPEKIIEIYEKTIERQSKYIKMMFVALMTIVLFIIAILIFDALHGDIGYFRY